MQNTALAESDNRRTSQRARIAIAVRKRVGNHIFLCQASDISTDGIFLAHVKDDGEPTEGAKCWLEFSLPGYPNVLIAARGEVVRQRNHAQYLLSAVRFASIAPSHRRLIGQYVSGPHMISSAPAFLPQG